MSGFRDIIASRKRHCWTMDAEKKAQKFTSGVQSSWHISVLTVKVTLGKNKMKMREREKRKGKTPLSGQRVVKCWGSPGKQPPQGSPPVQQGCPRTLSSRTDKGFIRTCSNSVWWFLLVMLLSLAGICWPGLVLHPHWLLHSVKVYYWISNVPQSPNYGDKQQG